MSGTANSASPPQLFVVLMFVSAALAGPGCGAGDSSVETLEEHEAHVDLTETLPPDTVLDTHVDASEAPSRPQSPVVEPPLRDRASAELARIASLTATILRVRVLAASVIDDGEGGLATRSELSVISALKGEAAATYPAVIPGGQTATRAWISPHSAKLRVGAEYVVFMLPDGRVPTDSAHFAELVSSGELRYDGQLVPFSLVEAAIATEAP
jgi:hypothetical protein